MLIWIVIISVVILAAIAFWFILPALIFRMYTRPFRLKNNKNPKDFGLDYSDHSFISNGTPHQGWLIFPPGQDGSSPLPIVIMPHGFAANRSDILERCILVARGGFLVFTFDWRAHGESGGNRCSGGLLEKNDLLNAVEFVRTLPEVKGDSVALYGFSMSATVCILAAAENTDIRTVVADSPFRNLRDISHHILKNMMLPARFLQRNLERKFTRSFGEGMEEADAEKVVASISPRPILFLGGTKDKIVPFEHVKHLFDLAGKPKNLHALTGGGHFDNANEQIVQTMIVPFLNSAFKNIPFVDPKTGHSKEDAN